MINGYLVAAYAIVWGIFIGYAWVVSRRQQRLERELEDVKRALGQK